MCFSDIKIGSLVEILDNQETYGLCDVGEHLRVADTICESSIVLIRSDKSMEKVHQHRSFVYINPVHVKLLK